MKLVDLRFESEDDFENEIYKFFRSHGYKVKIVNRERGIAKTEKLVAKLLNLLDFSPKACEYRQTFNSELSEYGHDSDRLWKLVEEAMADHELVLSTQAQTYIRLTLKPHLQNFYLENSGEKWIEISWQPRDVTQGLVHDLHDIPFWLLSTGGSSLIQRMGECAKRDAETGSNTTSFDMVQLLPNLDRWGINSMMKLVYKEEPIGVSPLPANMLWQVMQCLGFTANINMDSDLPRLSLAW